MRIKLFLAGDVMTGRGIDQTLPHPSHPRIYEPMITDARDYVALAERVSGKIPRPVSFDYIWGDALPEMEKSKPHLRIINLETAITKSETYAPKGINYRMNPQNIEVLKTFGIDVCLLANNHILDWGQEGLLETVRVLNSAKIQPIGAGKNSIEAKKPAIFAFEEGRIIVFAYAHVSSGVPHQWKAGENSPGTNVLANLSAKELEEIKDGIAAVKQNRDFVVFSIHWGPNWGYKIDKTFSDFAHRLIDSAGVDLIFGHSSHHFQGIEIYKDKLIIYGAGDFINDYEGIESYEEFRADLSLMYLPEVDLQTKTLVSLTLAPMHIKKFRLNYPIDEDVDWVLEVLRKQSKISGTLAKAGSRLEYEKPQ